MNRPEDTQAANLHPHAKKIVTLLPDYETLTLSQIVKLTQGKPSTVKLCLKELVEKGYLVPKGRSAGRNISEPSQCDCNQAAQRPLARNPDNTVEGHSWMIGSL